ncbi:TPA: PhoP/PhoQ regulator MgrB, partial [Serratia marcescens]|nr:PhoP/PhoQ regulator MgrB [Serratia marcescens]
FALGICSVTRFVPW